MISKTDQRRTSDWWHGKKVKTTTEMENGYMNIPKDKICTVKRKRGGLDLQSDPCKCCGISIIIRKVGFGHLQLWTEGNTGDLK